MQFFSFIAGIQAISHYLSDRQRVVPFMRDEIETIFNQPWYLIFQNDALDKADTPNKEVKQEVAY